MPPTRFFSSPWLPTRLLQPLVTCNVDLNFLIPLFSCSESPSSVAFNSESSSLSIADVLDVVGRFGCTSICLGSGCCSKNASQTCELPLPPEALVRRSKETTTRTCSMCALPALLQKNKTNKLTYIYIYINNNNNNNILYI